MALLNILTFPNSILRQKAQKVETFDSTIKTLVDDMLETMYDAPGVGLAANQVGILKRILVIDVDYDIKGDDEDERVYVKKNPRIFINPEILEKSGKILFKEGCLSVPGFSEEVERFEKIKVTYQDVSGKPTTLETDGLLAVALQHEMDHLEGKLFVDRLSTVKKTLIKGKLLKKQTRKFERSKFHVEL